MSSILTMDEIKAKYAPDWVLIVEPETDDLKQVLAGRVVFHSPDRDAVYDKAIELQPPHCAFRFLGAWPKDTELLL
jgi:hypothetical protein